MPHRIHAYARTAGINGATGTSSLHWQKLVVLPVEKGVGVGMIFDVCDNLVLVKGFLPLGSTKLNLRQRDSIQVGDILLAIDAHWLGELDFEEVLYLLRGISSAPTTTVTLMLCDGGCIGMSDQLRGIGPRKERLMSGISAGGHWGRRVCRSDQWLQTKHRGRNSKPGGHSAGLGAPQKNLSGPQWRRLQRRAIAKPKVLWYDCQKNRAFPSGGQTFAFPGDLGFQQDGPELERRLLLLEVDAAKHRLLRAYGRDFGWWESVKGSPLFRSKPVKAWARTFYVKSVRQGFHLSPHLCKDPGCMCGKRDPARTVVAGSHAHNSVNATQLAHRNNINDVVDADPYMLRYHGDMAGKGAYIGTLTKAQYPANEASGAFEARKRVLMHPMKSLERRVFVGTECARGLSDVRSVIARAKFEAGLSRALHGEYWQVSRHKFTGAATMQMLQFNTSELRGAGQSTVTSFSCSLSSPLPVTTFCEVCCGPCAIDTAFELPPTNCSRLAGVPCADVVTQMTHFWCQDMQPGSVITTLGIDIVFDDDGFIPVGALPVREATDAICDVSWRLHQQVTDVVHSLHQDKIARRRARPLMGVARPSRDLSLSFQGSTFCVAVDDTYDGFENRFALMNRAPNKKVTPEDIGGCEYALRGRTTTIVQRKLFDLIQSTTNSHTKTATQRSFGCVDNRNSFRYVTGTHQYRGEDGAVESSQRIDQSGLRSKFRRDYEKESFWRQSWDIGHASNVASKQKSTDGDMPTTRLRATWSGIGVIGGINVLTFLNKVVSIALCGRLPTRISTNSIILAGAGTRQFCALLTGVTGKEVGEQPISRFACRAVAQNLITIDKCIREDFFVDANAGLLQYNFESKLHQRNQLQPRERPFQILRRIILQARKFGVDFPVLLDCGQLLWWYDGGLASHSSSEAYPRVRPWHVWRIISASFGPLLHSIQDIGVRVRVWWAGNKAYFAGTVVAFRFARRLHGVDTEIRCNRTSEHGRRRRIGVHTIHYDDGDVREYDLKTKIYEVFAPGSSCANASTFALPLLRNDAVVQRLSRPSGKPRQLESLRMRCLWCSNSKAAFSSLLDVEEVLLSWWASRIMYHIYLYGLLHTKGRPSQDPRLQRSTVNEFLEMSLLLATNETQKRFAAGSTCFKTPSTTVRGQTIYIQLKGSSPWSQSSDGDEFSDTETSRPALERLLISIIQARQTPFFFASIQETKGATGAVANQEMPDLKTSDVMMDVAAWLVRVAVHTDYFNYAIGCRDDIAGRKTGIYKTRRISWAVFLNRWLKCAESNDPCHHCLPRHQHEEDEVETTGSSLRIFDEMAVYLRGPKADSLPMEVESYISSPYSISKSNDSVCSDSWCYRSSGYRSAWGRPRCVRLGEDASTGVALQDAWINAQSMIDGAGGLISRYGVRDPSFYLSIVCISIAIDNAYPCSESFLGIDFRRTGSAACIVQVRQDQRRSAVRYDGFQFAFCCVRYAYWDGVVGICRRWLRDWHICSDSCWQQALRKSHVRRHEDEKKRCLSHGLLTNFCSGSSLDPVRVYELLRLTALSAARCCGICNHATCRVLGNQKSAVRLDAGLQIKREWCASIIVAVVELVLALSNIFVTSRSRDAQWSEALIRRYFPLMSEGCLDRWCGLAAMATSSDRLIAGLIVDLMSTMDIQCSKFLASCTADALGPVRAAGMFVAISPTLFKAFRDADEIITTFLRASVATSSCVPVYSATYFLALTNGLKCWGIRCDNENLASKLFEEGSCQSLAPAHSNKTESKGNWGLVFESTEVCALCGLMLTDVGHRSINELWDWKSHEAADSKVAALAKCGHAFHRSCASSTFSPGGCPVCELSTIQMPWAL